MIPLMKSVALSPLQPVLAALDSLILGKPEQVRLSLACVLARGHFLIEDVPGVGKTTLARGLARVLGLETKRVQFTNDLLPADILGTAIFDSSANQFQFHHGPVFTNVLIADELNRGTPRTQSAFLQAMEERRVTLDGITRELPSPFLVVATQNPREQIGTYPLPESQLDRFLVRLKMGFPAAEFELDLLRGRRRREEDLPVILSMAEVLRFQSQVEQIHCSDLVCKYVQRILVQSRSLKSDFAGLSPRAGLALLSVARAWSFLAGREFVLPEDVQTVGPWVINHRLKFPTAMAFDKARDFLASVPVD
ncbi:MAG: AAA family ATPase [Bdellovibrionales bacterium]